MTKSSIQSLKEENDYLKCKLEILTKDFKELKELLVKKELTARARQDDRLSSPIHELGNSFLVTNSMTCRFLILLYSKNYPNFGRDLSNVLVKGEEMSHAVEVL